MSSSSSSSCLATGFVDGMGFVAPPPLRHLSPVPSHDGRQYRPHARLRMVVGRRGAQAEGGYQEVWRMGRGEIWVRRKWVFYRRVVHANILTHDFEAKKAKNRAMQRHGQVLPPCRCIAGIASIGGIHMPPILAPTTNWVSLFFPAFIFWYNPTSPT